MAYNLKNLNTPQNQGSGIAEFALVAPADWFTPTGIKAPVGPFNPNTPGASLTITAPHEFIQGKAFARFQLAPQKNDLKYMTVGDLGLNKQNAEVTIFIPGSYAEVHEAMAGLINTRLIVLVKDANCPANLYYQLGCDCQFAWMLPEFTTGTTKDGVKGYNVKIVYDGGPMFYNVPNGPALLVDTVSGAPVITSNPVSQNEAVTGTIALAVGATGTAPLTYQWKKGNANINGAIFAQYVKANAVVGDSGNYSCVVTNPLGTATSSVAVVTIT